LKPYPVFRRTATVYFLTAFFALGAITAMVELALNPPAGRKLLQNILVFWLYTRIVFQSFL
jgi:hypothetical protein